MRFVYKKLYLTYIIFCALRDRGSHQIDSEAGVLDRFLSL